MCMAILALPGSLIPEEHIERAWRVNSDGGGFAYVNKLEDGSSKVVVNKGYRVLDRFLQAYNATVAQGGHFKSHPHILHLRYRTAGTHATENVHPFEIPGGALMHNGTLFWVDRGYKSDTNLFAEEFGASLTHDKVKENMVALNKALSGNKIAMLYDDGKYAIINEHCGIWKNGIWYSNGGFR
jgi:glutamine phosphoribosylpyrophosphate amidotransferase